MALESLLAIAPPSVGAGNKDTQNSGEYQSDDNVQDESFSTTDPADLEEGEILDDSEGEPQEKVAIKDLQTVVFVSMPTLNNHNNEEFDMDDEPGNIGRKKRKKKKKRKDEGEENNFDHTKTKKKVKYVDHDRVQDEEGWFQGSPPSNFRRTSGKDYRRNYDSPYNSPHNSPNADYSPDRNRSESPSSMHSMDEKGSEFDHGMRGRRSIRARLGKRRVVLGRKQQADRGGFKKKKPMSGMMRVNDLKKKRRLLRPKRREPRQRATCKFYLEGKCLKGNDCPFAHNTTPPKKKDLCKFFLNGYCAKGEKCLYMHGDFPCKFFHSGAQCYAEPNCKFSHEPMSEEMERIFKKFLEKSKKEEEEMEMMFAEEANSPPRQKRPSLLGSPPRHVKEAAETWQWQQEMLQMQRNKRGGRNGGIQRVPFIRPNFYMDTMSPIKQPMIYNHERQGGPAFGGPPFEMYNAPPESPPRDCQTPIPTDEEDMNNFDDDERKDADYESALWDESSTIPHSAESPPQEPVLSPENIPCESDARQNPLSPPSSDPQGGLSSPQPNQASSPSIIPTHLPRRQRELFLRIQQHQKEVSANGESNEEQESSKTEETSEEEAVVEKKEVAEEVANEVEDEADEKSEEAKEKWYSSDEDDDTEDQPLAEVLKKLQQTPLPPRSQPLASAPASTTVSQSIDISKMLNNIRQQANQQVFSMQSEFWQNILSTAAPAVLPKPTEQPIKPQTVLNRDPRCRETKQPLLATPAEPSVVAQAPVTSRDPRTSNRDPRSVNRLQSARQVDVKPVTPEVSEDKVWEVRAHGRTADGKMNSTSYRIHTVSVTPRDYSPYLHATQNDMKLLGDPRLKKLLADSPSMPLFPFPPDLRPNSEKAKELDVARPLLEPCIFPELGVRKMDPRLSRGSAKSTTDSHFPAVPAALLNPPTQFPRPVIDPRLARLHQPSEIQRMPQKRPTRPKPKKFETADGAVKMAEKSTFKQPALPPKKEETNIGEKEAIGGSINRKSILDYASPLGGSYDEGCNTGSSYSGYNRRPQQRIPPQSSQSLADSATVPAAAVANAGTTCAPTSVQGTFQCNIPGDVAVNPQDAVSGFDPCLPDVEDAIHSSLKDVFKTIDPTASPFC